MSSRNTFNALLPKNSSKLEQQIDKLSVRVDNLPVTFDSLIDPDSCPVPFLPWLAWSRRVEFWRSEWSESDKRKVIKESRSFNTSRGTKSALVKGMEYLALGYEITPWHALHPKGQPYTFTIKITSGRISVQQQQAIYTTLNSVKSARDLYSIEAQVVHINQHWLGGITRTGEKVYLRMKS